MAWANQFSHFSLGFQSAAAATDPWQYTAGTSTPTGGAAGQIWIALLATDNRTTTDGNTNDHVSLTSDDEGSWTKIYEFTNGNAAAAAGATISAWWTVKKVDGSLRGGAGNANADFSGTITAKVINFAGFSIGASSIAQRNAATPATRADDAADPGSMTLGSLTNAEHLWVRATAAETNSTTNLTATAGWTSAGIGTSGQTSGGGAAANMALRYEFIIATATTETSDPTFTAVDCASILFAMDEVATGKAFPFETRHRQRNALLRRASGLFVPAHWKEKILIPDPVPVM